MKLLENLNGNQVLMYLNNLIKKVNNDLNKKIKELKSCNTVFTVVNVYANAANVWLPKSENLEEISKNIINEKLC